MSYRHRIRTPRKTNPWATTLGQGIHEIDLEIHKGQILGLIGANGAGKTTLLRILSGLYLPLSGKINYSDSDLRRKVGFMPEQVRWEGRTSVKESLKEIMLMHGVTDDPEILLEKVGLKGRVTEELDNLSQGMRQRLSLACALIGQPEFLVLDEPMNGLDPIAQRAFASLLTNLAEKGLGIIVSSHQVAGMTKLVDSIALLHRGQLLITGDLSDVENKLGLSGRIVFRGQGDPPNGTTSDVDGWLGTSRDSPESIIQQYSKKGLQYIERKPLDLVELICAATGMTPENTGMDIVSSDLIPLRSWGEEE